MLSPNHKPEDVTRRCLTAAEYFLRDRNYADCLNYARRARDVDATHPEPTRILSIASVLSAPNISTNLSDYYAILNLPRFEANVARIWYNYQTLESNLNPKVNRHSFCSEALGLASRAWEVLSNPSEKAKYDVELKRNLGDGTFWTMCPYCYYVYEYDRAVEDCSLRCNNERCRRVLHAVEIAATPPQEVVERGYYCCPGFVQLAASGNSDGENMWVPFDCPGGVQSCKSSEGEMECKEAKKQRKTYVHWDSKKLMGREVKLGHSVHGAFGDGSMSTGGKGGDLGVASGGKTKDGNAGGVEFFEGDDDVLVGLESDYNIDLANDEL